jgi:hypothetical protein
MVGGLAINYSSGDPLLYSINADILFCYYKLLPAQAANSYQRM